MTLFSEWQQMPQTREFVKQLRSSVEQIKDEAIGARGHESLEQIAISTLERQAEARILEIIIQSIITEEDNEQS